MEQWIELKFPEEEVLVRILEAKAHVSREVAKRLAYVVYRLRELPLRKSRPSFSDTPTYATPLMAKPSSFRQQFEQLKAGADSWEYGTRLSLALQQVNNEQRYTQAATIVLITDGGFSLADPDWETTVRQLVHLKSQVNAMILVTPNQNLVDEGQACEEALWNVERDPRPSGELLSASLQKTARYGLLNRYCDQVAACRTEQELRNLMRLLTQIQSPS